MAEISKATTGTVKRFVLDCSVLIHDPNAIFNFEENYVYIGVKTIDELRQLAGQPGERGANARTALRKLMNLFNPQNVSRAQSIIKKDPALNGRTAATPTETEGLVILLDMSEDDTIFSVTKKINGTLVTKDVSQRLSAMSKQVHVEDYKHDKTVEGDQFYTGRSIIYIPSSDISALKSGERVSLPENIQVYKYDEKTQSEVQRDGTYTLSENEFLIVKSCENPQKGGALARYTKGSIVRLNFEDCRPFDVQPRNVGQKFAIEALMTSCEDAPLVILRGPAGTAKTFLSMACGLQNTYNDDVYRSLLVTRQSSLLDESPGYLPGTEQEKVSPLLRSVFDNIESLMPNTNKTMKDGVPTGGPVEELISRGILQVQAMTFMRGRSIANTFVVIDEAQNCTPQQLLTLVTRVSQGTKIVLLGDTDQIDNPYLDKFSNGLTFVSEKMRGSKLCWQVTFQEDECERSALATEAIRRLTQGT